MLLELLLILPLYIGIFVILFRFRHTIKIMIDVEEYISDLMSDIPEELNKREFLIGKIKNGESISNSKTPWTEERLQKASDKVIDKLYEKYQNPPPIKIDKNEALKLGEPVCPVLIDMYAEGMKTILGNTPYMSGKYTINVEKLKVNISGNKLFCDNLAIKIGSKLIEQMGNNSSMNMGLSLASMTWDAIEPVQKEVLVEDNSENKSDD